MDPLESAGDDGAHAEQAGALGRPVARAARAVVLSGDHDERHALGAVALRRVVDGHALAVGWWRVTPPSTPGTIRFRMRTLANVPRTMTSWLPRRAP